MGWSGWRGGWGRAGGGVDGVEGVEGWMGWSGRRGGWGGGGGGVDGVERAEGWMGWSGWNYHLTTHSAMALLIPCGSSVIVFPYTASVLCSLTLLFSIFSSKAVNFSRSSLISASLSFNSPLISNRILCVAGSAMFSMLLMLRVSDIFLTKILTIISEKV